MARLLASTGAAMLLSALLLVGLLLGTVAAASDPCLRRQPGALLLPPGFMRAQQGDFLQCRGGEASISKAAGAAMAAASEQHNASSAAPGGVAQQQTEEDEENDGEEAVQFHDAVSGDAEAAEAPAQAAALAVAADEEEEEEEEAAGEQEEEAAVAAVEQELSGPEAVRRRRAEEAGAAEGGKKVKDKYNAKMQWVITGRMKKALVEELHYLPEEVEAMMPDVAAVVINKHLERPKRGMPPEWRRDFHLRSRGLKRVRASLRTALAMVREDPGSVLRKALTAGAAAAVVVGAKRWRDARAAAGEEEEYEWVEMTPWEELVDTLQTRLPFRK